MNIIGISGFAGSGKDTVADFFIRHEGFVKIALADPIKRFAMDVWGFSEQQLFGASEFRSAPDFRYPISNDKFLTPRLVLQHLGTEGARAIDEDVWIRYAIRIATRLIEAKPRELCYSNIGGLESYIENFPHGEYVRNENFPEKVKAVIISDCRFANEMNEIKKVGGKLIRVVRSGAGLSGNFALHQSEVEMSEISDSEFDFVIQNTGTLDQLKIEVDNVVNSLNLK